MAKILVLGGGLCGCTAALELAAHGHKVFIIEKSSAIGGKVRWFGCKATQSCNKCGLCITKDLWEQVENHANIEIRYESQLMDLTGQKGNYRAVVKKVNCSEVIDELEAVFVCVGFDQKGESSGNIEFEGSESIISGYQLEKQLANRQMQGLFENPPVSAAFIQCFGSRDLKEKAGYCSRVCCGYSTRMAKVLREYYPDMKIVFFYMDLQQVEDGNYLETLKRKNIEFIRSKPVKIKRGKPASVLYEKPGDDGIVEEAFDLIVLTEGIHPPSDAAQLAEICGLGLNENGFLKQIANNPVNGIYLAGCASGPKKIVETYTEALTCARELCAILPQQPSNI